VRERVLRSDDRLPPAERFAAWRDQARAIYAPAEFRPDHADGFRATARRLDLGHVVLSTSENSPLQVSRTPKLVRQGDPELCIISLVQRGSLSLTQARREATLAPGDLVLYSTSRPNHAHLADKQGRMAMTNLVFRRALLPLPTSAVDRLLAVRLPSRHGPGALLAQFFTHLTTEATAYGPSDDHRLATVACDIVAALLGQYLDTPVSPEARHHALLFRIHTFIQQNLGDPDLTPATIASAHHLSVRSLHRLFHDGGESVAAFIRRHRLEQACRDLANPAVNARPIHAIAARWCFPRPADFTRAFRTAYGIRPSEYRRLASMTRWEEKWVTSYPQHEMRAEVDVPGVAEEPGSA
jgi:AraC-like DNA-binding protein